ncbi:MAG: NAD(P)H-dependent oxidoreductase [bacterium]|nr:NAD(P)H-dependent oxidoreductase [bacterium]
MKKLLIVLSSVRSGRAADNILKLVQDELKDFQDFSVQIADFNKMPLPFFNADKSPSADDFRPEDANVIKWGEMVDEADAVIFLTAEYNHSYTPVIKNAIDWLYQQWDQKPVALIGYGWVGGARAIKHLRDVLASNINANALPAEATLNFTKEINIDGTANDSVAVTESIQSVLNGIKDAVSEPVTV